MLSCHSRLTRTCCAMPQDTRWRTKGPTRGPCKRTWGTARSNRRCATPSSRRGGSRTFGADSLAGALCRAATLPRGDAFQNRSTPRQTTANLGPYADLKRRYSRYSASHRFGGWRTPPSHRTLLPKAVEGFEHVTLTRIHPGIAVLPHSPDDALISATPPPIQI